MASLKVRDVAARLNVSEKTVYKWLTQGLIPATKLGRTWVVTEEALEAAILAEETAIPVAEARNNPVPPVTNHTHTRGKSPRVCCLTGLFSWRRLELKQGQV